jgi:SAM-dependent methyltransferase
MKECSKSIPRRLAHPNFVNRFFVGDGLDIGGKPDPLVLYLELFTRMRSVRTWDLEDGDAQFLEGVADASFDFVHSSHCLEHLRDPREGLRNWFRVLKPGGHLIVTVPDEDLYEQGQFPSTFNLDHKWTFTIHKPSSWSERSVNVLSLVEMLGLDADVQRVELLNTTYRYGLPRYDQTKTPVGESGIELVVRKRTQEEVAHKGSLRPEVAQPPPEVRVHLNQYRDDMATLKAANPVRPPFQNEDPL